MKLGLVTYNLAFSWDLDTLIEKCGRLGFEGVELRTTHKHGVEPSLTAKERASEKFTANVNGAREYVRIS